VQGSVRCEPPQPSERVSPKASAFVQLQPSTEQTSLALAMQNRLVPSWQSCIAILAPCLSSRAGPLGRSATTEDGLIKSPPHLQRGRFTFDEWSHWARLVQGKSVAQHLGSGSHEHGLSFVYAMLGGAGAGIPRSCFRAQGD
jgi:hypothetical protein